MEVTDVRGAESCCDLVGIRCGELPLKCALRSVRHKQVQCRASSRCMVFAYKT